MNKKLWEFNETGIASIECDANDFFYSWASLQTENMNLEELFEEFLKIDSSEVKIRVKAREGAIFIVLDGDKDDTPNPTK